jgi:hypothetical protein
VTLPPGIGGNYYIYVFTNVINSQDPLHPQWPDVAGGNQAKAHEQYVKTAYEFPLNNMGQAPLPVIYREPDLRVTDLIVPQSAVAGATVEVTFTVSNVGNRETRESNWEDALYLSLDPSLDSGDLRLDGELVPGDPATARSQGHPLGIGESYTTTLRVAIPFDMNGDYHILAFADADAKSYAYAKSALSSRLVGLRMVSGGGAVREFQGEGNNITQAPLAVTPYVAPDLQVTALTAPERAVRGQSFDISYTITNLGGATPSQQGAHRRLGGGRRIHGRAPLHRADRPCDRGLLRVRRDRSDPLRSDRRSIRGSRRAQQRSRIRGPHGDRAAAADRPGRYEHRRAGQRAFRRAVAPAMDRHQPKRCGGKRKLVRLGIPVRGRHLGYHRPAARARAVHRLARAQ